jgi:hypothetical protein
MCGRSHCCRRSIQPCSTEAMKPAAMRRWDAVAKSVGFAHHHATVLGTNIVTLAALMGHASIKMLSEIYAHVGANASLLLVCPPSNHYRTDSV